MSSNVEWILLVLDREKLNMEAEEADEDMWVPSDLESESELEEEEEESEKKEEDEDDSGGEFSSEGTQTCWKFLSILFSHCGGRLCVHDFITHNSSKLSNRTFLPYFCHSFDCFEVVVILPLFVDLIIDENCNGHEKLKKSF